MASIAEQVQLLPQVVSDTRTTNYLTLAASMVLLYDMVLTFPTELDLVWKARWTAGNVLYILNRYPVFMISAFLLAYMFDYTSAYDWKLPDSFTILSVSLRRSCVASNYIEAWSMLVFIIPVQVVLILRTLALWEQNWKIRAFLLAVFLATDITIIVSISLVTKSLTFEDRQIVKPILGCYGSLNDVSMSHTIPSWIALIIFDTIVFVLTVVRVEGIRRAKRDRSLLLHILFRDGIVFYVIMLASSVANLVLYSKIPLQRRGLIISLIPLLRTVMSVCTARLLLNLRSVALNHGGSGQHWALGELDVDVQSNISFSRTAVSSSSSTTRYSFGAQRLAKERADIVAAASVPAPVDEPSVGSRRGQIVISVRREEEQHSDLGDASQPSSFRISILNRFTNMTNSNIELGEIRPNLLSAARR